MKMEEQQSRASGDSCFRFNGAYTKAVLGYGSHGDSLCYAAATVRSDGCRISRLAK